jgi:hypothetical protein
VHFTTPPVAGLTSSSLEDLKRLIVDAQGHRTSRHSMLQLRRQQLDMTVRRLRRAQAFMLRLFLRHRIADLANSKYEAERGIAATEAELRACIVNIDFALDHEGLARFLVLLRIFEDVSLCQRTWDVTSASMVDTVRERTTASYALERKRVLFRTGDFELVHSEQLDELEKSAFALRCADGTDIHIYPGLVIVARGERDFALLDLSDVSIQFSASNFVEEEYVPSDSEIVGQTWKKANKDGSRDLRFQGNYQIPVVRYGALRISAPNGLNKLFHFSDYAKASAFASSLLEFQSATRAQRSKPLELPAPENSEDSSASVDESAAFEPPPLPRRLWLDVTALIAISAGLAAIGLYTPQILSLFEPSKSRPAVSAVSPPAVPVVPTPAPLESVRVRLTTVNIRSRPSTSSAIVEKVRRGTELKVFQRQGDWIEVGTSKPVGWVRGDLVGPSASAER